MAGDATACDGMRAQNGPINRAVAVGVVVLAQLASACAATPSATPSLSTAPRSLAAESSATPVASAVAPPSATTPPPPNASGSASPPAPSSASPTASARSEPAILPTLFEPAAYRTARFPTGYAAYHTYGQMSAEVRAVAAAHPDLVRMFSIGRSYEGAPIWAVRISQDVAVDHGRPEALFDGLHHALEHMSLEMTLAILHWLVDGYGHDSQVTSLLRSRVVDIVFAVNPDGASYDVAGGTFHRWRKNRQPDGGAIGTDLNRNYADHWGCCGLVSANPASPYFRGAAPFSAPETRALAAFIRSRVIDGRQRITVAVTFHTSGRLILWPYGFTHAAIAGRMTTTDHAVFVALARAMARRDGYTAEQASGLYVDSGTERDWDYGAEHIFAFTMELATGLYQPSAAIRPELARNRSAILYLIGMADCPYRAIGGSCG